MSVFVCLVAGGHHRGELIGRHGCRHFERLGSGESDRATAKKNKMITRTISTRETKAKKPVEELEQCSGGAGRARGFEARDGTSARTRRRHARREGSRTMPLLEK
jgi:hypothetical protein